MADLEKQKLEQVAGLVEKFRAHQAKGYELLEAIKALLDSEASPGQLAKRALDHFATLWQNRYKGKLIVNGARDMATLKRLLKQTAIDDLERRMALYFLDEDGFVRNAQHSLAVFSHNINAYGRAASRNVEAAATDCRHEPRCTSDVEHTRRRTDDAKGSPF